MAKAEAVVRVDPVCGMTVADDSPLRTEHEGELYLFCSAGCKQQFDSHPGRFAAAEIAGPHADPHVDAGAYTCPMHPEVTSSAPGACPICGMALERRSPVRLRRTIQSSAT